MHRGVIAIHAGSYKRAVDVLVPPNVNREIFAFGAIIGTVELHDVVPYGEAKHEDWAEGPFCFRLRNATLFNEPLPHKGRVNLCTLSSDVADSVTSHGKELADANQDNIRELINTIPKEPIDESLLRPKWKY